MKRTFLAKRNALLFRAYTSWGGYALAIVLLLFLLRAFAPNLFWSVLSPVLTSANAVAFETHAFLSSFGNSAALSLENERLTDENRALANENQILIERSAALEELGGSAGSKDTRGIVAGVVARPPTSPYDTLVLSKGTSAGVAPGMEAFGSGGVPLGVVTSVIADFSQVTLFSAPNTTVNGSIGHSNLPLVVRGAGAGAMHASAPHSAGVEVGDTVFAPGPGLLPIGTVVHISTDASSPSVTLQIQSALNLFSVAWVELRATGPAFTESLFSSPSTP
jgi:cell shape-determining protein MreC